MYWKRCSTGALRTPGDCPGGCRGLSGSLMYTKRSPASSILPTQLVPARGIPVTRSGRAACAPDGTPCARTGLSSATVDRQAAPLRRGQHLVDKELEALDRRRDIA